MNLFKIQGKDTDAANITKPAKTNTTAPDPLP